VTVWSHDLVAKQRLATPAEIFSLAGLGEGGLAVGCGDNAVHVFTTAPSAAPSAAFAAAFAAATAGRAAAALTLPTTRALTGAAAAALGSGAPFLTAAPAHTEPAHTATAGGPGAVVSGGQGPRPDFSFPVDLGGGAQLTISWNRGDEATATATRFCVEHGISVDQLGDIVAFVHQAQGSAGSSAPLLPASAEKAAMVAQLVAMGFDDETATLALERVGWVSVDAAVLAIFE
jgi:hypothetical protein